MEMEVGDAQGVRNAPMNIVLVSGRCGSARSFSVGAGMVAGLVGLVLSLLLIGGGVGYVLHDPDTTLIESKTSEWDLELKDQAAQVGLARKEAEQQVDALTVRLSELQARLLRIESLGERLAGMADLDADEFDFSDTPALGGPEIDVSGSVFRQPEFLESLEQLSSQIEARQQQLEIVGLLMGDRQFQKDVFLTGRPVRKGWLSSRYGRRTDPITGRLAWHSGVDFAGKRGSDVVAVAAGVVTYSGKKHGYGLLVEVNHGSGYATRYAHCQENLVKVGDVVRKGQTLALMGSSGRSTGPHVHFEVLKNGRPANPAEYIHRASR